MISKDKFLAQCLVCFFVLLCILAFSEISFDVVLYDDYNIHRSNPYTLWKCGLSLGGLIVSFILSKRLSNKLS